MMITKKLSILIFGVIGIAFFLNGLLSGSAHAQKAIEWRMLCAWGPEYVVVRNSIIPFVEKVNQRAAGRLKISWVGPEAVPPFEQFKPVREGIFDAVLTHSAYHIGEVAGGSGMDLFSATAKERRAAGLYKILDEAYRKKGNVSYFGAMVGGVGYQLLLKKKLDKADLTGLKIRTSPFYDPMVKGLGGAPVRTSQGEIYSALEKGVVDGATWTSFGMTDYKMHEVVKYIVKPRFGEVVSPVLVNLNSWNRLSKDLQDLLTEIEIEIEEKYRTAMIATVENEDKELQKLGMEFLTLPPKEAEKFLSTFYERSWEELVLKRDPEFGPRLKEAADRMKTGR